MYSLIKEILFPAGHVEIGESPIQTALREFDEETGNLATVSQSGRALIDLNLITIPEYTTKNTGEHRHIDFRYTFEIEDFQSNRGELPTYLLGKQQAPLEFRQYFNLTRRNNK
jgi:8-oxo-dGTP pyrophosphatase MutT (NUDIX family)